MITSLLEASILLRNTWLRNCKASKKDPLPEYIPVENQVDVRNEFDLRWTNMALVEESLAKESWGGSLSRRNGFSGGEYTPISSQH